MEYMPTRAYFALDAKETAELQREAGYLRATVESKEASWVERTRAASRLQTGERELQTARTAERMAGHAAQPQRSLPSAVNAGQQEHAPCVPYFEVEQPRGAATPVGNAGAVEWPQDFVARTELLTAAIAEVRRLGLAG